MPTRIRTAAPEGQLTTFASESFTHDGFTHDVYRKGTGPAVLVLTEMPGISPQVLGFADRLVDLGLTAVLPDLFGTAGRDPLAGGKAAGALYVLMSITSACISREFSVFAAGGTSPVVTFLRALAALEHERCGGPGVGVVGMCFTGGFALAMAADPLVLAPVMSQPSLPLSLPFGRGKGDPVDCSPEELDAVAHRCANEGLRVLGLRFKGDPAVPSERFRFLKERLGDGFVAVELEQSDRHPNGPMPKAHSVLTGDLIDEPGEPTRDALQQVLDLFQEKLAIAVSGVQA